MTKSRIALSKIDCSAWFKVATGRSICTERRLALSQRRTLRNFRSRSTADEQTSRLEEGVKEKLQGQPDFDCESSAGQRAEIEYRATPASGRLYRSPSVEMRDASAFPLSACSNARHGSIAHFTRCGNFLTPLITRRSPSA